MASSQRGRWMRWHRWLGLLLLLPILFLVITGVLISVSEVRGWQHEPVQARLLSALYGVPPDVPVAGYRVGDHWLTQQGGRLRFNAEVVTRCADTLVGAVRYQSLVAALCGETLILLGDDAALIEMMSGAPAQGRRLGTDEAGHLLVATRAGLHEFDALAGAWRERSPDDVEWAQEASLPDALREQLAQGAPLPGISRERVVLDLHSGRLFGRAGVWAVNAAAILMGLLALSGAWTWLGRVRKR
ncbi:PepSY domain-containing protein [Alcanivorax sp. JB21]|uniref:PepSY domain-containing protein n=1 Tax=Alcanivorax limicola TaxID=2874102 RepID=UPI001CBFBFE7|nr:PepSY domain-containing protein [Alcanivorax limicola]MBZ2188688.1 PepSY domain-containing protein [Alcanivorax limicola]